MQDVIAQRKNGEPSKVRPGVDNGMTLLRRLLGARKKTPPIASPEAPAITLAQYESMIPVMTLHEGDTRVVFATPNTHTRFRADTFFSKEPDTVEWIRGFAPEDVLVDIGANVGMYAIWAAKTRGIRVYAFEPESQNYALLYQNIVLNDLMDKVTGYCGALSDEDSVSLLHLSLFVAGGSSHTFGSASDANLQPRRSVYTQGCFGTSLDALVARGTLPVPTHVKIDVDGLEHKVIAGARATLADRNVKSVLVEINTNLAEHRALVEQMQALGFSYSEEAVAAAQRREGPLKGMGNYVFRR